MTDVDAARRALEDALGPAEVLSDPLALKLYARDASMVEGGCALVAFPRSTDDIVACVRDRAEHGLPDRAARERHRSRRRRHPDRRRARGRHRQDARDPRGADRGSSRVGRAGSAQPRPVDRAPSDRLLVRARPVVAADVLDRRERRTRTPAARTAWRTASRPRTCSRWTSCMPDGSVERLGQRGARGARLRPARRRRRLRGDARHRRAGLRAADAAPTRRSARCCSTSWTSSDCAATVSDIIARGVVPAAVEMMDHGIIVAAESFAHAGYPTDAAAILIVEVDGLPSGVEAQTREVEAAAHANRVRTIRVAADDDGARPAVEGAQVRVRRGRADRAPLPPARLRRAAHEARRGADGRLRDREAPRPDRDERLPRRRRQPPPAALVRPARAGNARARAGRRATRSSGCASTRAAR